MTKASPPSTACSFGRRQRLTLTVAVAVTTLSLSAEAWSPAASNIASGPRRSYSVGAKRGRVSSELWASPVADNDGSNDAKATGHGFDRRQFFRAAVTGAASVVAATTVLPNEAYAASSPPSYYEPPPRSMIGKTVLITGGNTGLGLESTKRLAAAGATVVFTSRSAEKGERALAEVESYLVQKQSIGDGGGCGTAMVVTLDLCDLEDVKSFPDRLTRKIGEKKVDVLMNNAGVMAIPDRLVTKDGFEQTFQTNHLGHFVLTAKMLPLLSDKARIINVSSLAYQIAGGKGLELDNLNGEREYGPWSSYGQSKLANIMFTNEIQERALRSSSSKNIVAFSLHPGAVQTDLARYLIGEEKFNDMKVNGFSSWKEKTIMETLAKFVKTVQDGASTQIFLAASGDVDATLGGQFFSDLKPLKLSNFATDKVKAEELWALSEKLSGVKFEL